MLMCYTASSIGRVGRVIYQLWHHCNLDTHPIAPWMGVNVRLDHIVKVDTL